MQTLPYQGQVDTYRACANATVGQNKVADDMKSKSAINSSKNGFALPGLRKGRHKVVF